MNNEMFLSAGNTLQAGKYEVLSVLGSGGFGITYLAQHKILDLKVAIKELFLNAPGTLCTRDKKLNTIIPNFAEEQFLEFKKRFIHEAKILAKLKNVSGIVNVMDVFEENGTAYYVMDYIEGSTLKKIVEENGVLPIDEAVRIAIQILNGLEEVHERGILHRDINPSNILLDKKSEPYLIDFGISKEFESVQEVTHTTFRTPGYSPPEQAAIKAIRGAFTDTYALGATLYFMLTGERPQTLEEIQIDGKKKLFEEYSYIPSQILNIIDKSLQLKPTERYQTAKDFKKDLLSFQITYNKNIPHSTLVNRKKNNFENNDDKTLIESEFLKKEKSSNNNKDNINQNIKNSEGNTSLNKEKNRKKTLKYIISVFVFIFSSLFVYLVIQQSIKSKKNNYKLVKELLEKSISFLDNNNADSAWYYIQKAKLLAHDSLMISDIKKYNSLEDVRKEIYNRNKEAGDRYFVLEEYVNAKEKYLIALENCNDELLRLSINEKISICDKKIDEELPPLLVIDNENNKNDVKVSDEDEYSIYNALTFKKKKKIELTHPDQLFNNNSKSIQQNDLDKIIGKHKFDITDLDYLSFRKPEENDYVIISKGNNGNYHIQGNLKYKNGMLITISGTIFDFVKKKHISWNGTIEIKSSKHTSVCKISNKFTAKYSILEYGSYTLKNWFDMNQANCSNFELYNVYFRFYIQ